MIFLRTIIFALFLNAVLSTVVHAEQDSSKIYVTRQQFDADSAQYSCACRVQERGDFFWSDFNFEASGVLRVNGKGNKRRWPAGSIYGFYMNRIKYVYVPSEKKYLAVLDSKLPVPLFVKEYAVDRHISAIGMIVYLNPADNMTEELTRKNLHRDFGTKTILFDKMVALNAKLEKYKEYISRKYFFKCQQVTIEAQ